MGLVGLYFNVSLPCGWRVFLHWRLWENCLPVYFERVLLFAVIMPCGETDRHSLMFPMHNKVGYCSLTWLSPPSAVGAPAVTVCHRSWMITHCLSKSSFRSCFEDRGVMHLFSDSVWQFYSQGVNASYLLWINVCKSEAWKEDDP